VNCYASGYSALGKRLISRCEDDSVAFKLLIFEMYLFAIPAIMLGSILFLGGIVLLLEPRNERTPKRWLKSGRR
jgi:hypothetical protein